MVKRYEFEGEMLSAGQISRRYPAWSESTWGLALSQGVRSLADMQERDRRCKANALSAARRPGRVEPKVLRKDGHKRGTYRDDLNSMGLKA